MNTWDAFIVWTVAVAFVLMFQYAIGGCDEVVERMPDHPSRKEKP